MNDCENIRELLPSLVRGELSARDAIITQTHADNCADCRAELSIIRVMSVNLAPLPVGLEARVLSAVRNVRPVRRWAPARLAMAATVAAAVIGASAMFQRFDFGDPSSVVALTSDEFTAVGWAAAEDPMLHGGSAIQEMTVQELEMILAELDQ